MEKPMEKLSLINITKKEELSKIDLYYIKGGAPCYTCPCEEGGTATDLKNSHQGLIK